MSNCCFVHNLIGSSIRVVEAKGILTSSWGYFGICIYIKAIEDMTALLEQSRGLLRSARDQEYRCSFNHFELVRHLMGLKLFPSFLSPVIHTHTHTHTHTTQPSNILLINITPGNNLKVLASFRPHSETNDKECFLKTNN